MTTDALHRFSMRELRLGLIAVSTVIVGLVLVTIVAPQVRSLQAAIKEAELIEAVAVSTSNVADELQQQHALNEQFRHRLQGDLASQPLRQVEAFVIGRLQRVSWNNSVELVSVEPSTGESIQEFQELLFNVELAGGYEDLYRWLLEMREQLGFVVVKEFALSRKDLSDDDPLLLANLSLASYRAVE